MYMYINVLKRVISVRLVDTVSVQFSSIQDILLDSSSHRDFKIESVKFQILKCALNKEFSTDYLKPFELLESIMIHLLDFEDMVLNETHIQILKNCIKELTLHHGHQTYDIKELRLSLEFIIQQYEPSFRLDSIYEEPVVLRAPSFVKENVSEVLQGSFEDFASNSEIYMDRYLSHAYTCLTQGKWVSYSNGDSFVSPPAVPSTLRRSEIPDGVRPVSRCGSRPTTPMLNTTLSEHIGDLNVSGRVDSDMTLLRFLDELSGQPDSFYVAKILRFKTDEKRFSRES